MKQNVYVGLLDTCESRSEAEAESTQAYADSAITNRYDGIANRLITSLDIRECTDGAEGFRINKESSLTRSLERKVKLPVLVIDKTAETIHHPRSFRETDMYRIIHINRPVSIHVPVTNIPRHDTSICLWRVIDLRLISE